MDRISNLVLRYLFVFLLSTVGPHYTADKYNTKSDITQSECGWDEIRSEF